MSDFAKQLRISELFGWHVYAIAESDGEYCKIGTASRPKYRIEGIQNGNPRRLIVISVWHVQSRAHALDLEAKALKIVGERRLSGRDWIRCDAATAKRAVTDAAEQLNIEVTVVPQ